MEETKFNATVAVDLEESDINEPQDQQNISEEYLDLLEDQYERYAADCESAMDKALLSINILNKAFEHSDEGNPFDRIEHRLKKFKSVKGKCRDRGYALTLESIVENIRDVAGIRIITKYLDEVNIIKEMIFKIPDINVISVKDYIESPKKNGYKSIHLNCQVGIYDPLNGSRMRPVEIQIRSETMHLWASHDHDLIYKNEIKPQEIEDELLDIAESCDKFESRFINLRNKVRALKKAESN
ncbi:hypothetical protein IJI79_02825 [Candidatus Saccharibacteria bacterium]|nr:hypothetical protein [Candidatus Saccharibacteria bacterium]